MVLWKAREKKNMTKKQRDTFYLLQRKKSEPNIRATSNAAFQCKYFSNSDHTFASVWSVDSICAFGVEIIYRNHQTATTYRILTWKRYTTNNSWYLRLFVRYTLFFYPIQLSMNTINSTTLFGLQNNHNKKNQRVSEWERGRYTENAKIIIVWYILKLVVSLYCVTWMSRLFKGFFFTLRSINMRF